MYRYLYYDLSDHKLDKQHAEAIVSLVQDRVTEHLDACTAFLHDCVPLASLVAEGLKMRHTPSYAAVLAGNKKALTLSTLNARAATREPFPELHPAVFSSPVASVRSLDDLQEAVKKVLYVCREMAN